MTHDAAMAVSHAREAAWNAASALDALAAALRRLDTAEALDHAIEAAGAARLAREWANELIGNP